MVIHKAEYLKTMEIIYGPESPRLEEFKILMDRPDATEESIGELVRNKLKFFMEQEINISITMADVFEIIKAGDAREMTLNDFKTYCIPGTAQYEEKQAAYLAAKAFTEHWVAIRNKFREENPLP